VGLDGVELVLSVEEEFEIGIDDADVANLTTPRMLADYVVFRLGALSLHKGRCLSQAAFYRIRSVLVKQFGVLRKDVHPASPIDQLLKGDIRRQWLSLIAAAGATQVPRLQCKKSIYYPITLGVPSVFAVLLLLGGFSLWGLLVAFFVLWIAANIVTARMADMVPSDVSTIGALVPYVRAANREDWSRDYVLQRVIHVTAAQLGIPAEEIHPDHQFVKDLGLDS
jgi:acyl carrier protein